MQREIAFDCRYFLGDRPCCWHKQEGAVCICDRYTPIRERILIVKLDAMGDVLRTTTLLPDLAEVHPGATFTWITRPESLPLLAQQSLPFRNRPPRGRGSGNADDAVVRPRHQP